MPEISFRNNTVSLHWTKITFKSHFVYLFLCLFFLSLTFSLCIWQLTRGLDKGSQLSNISAPATELTLANINIPAADTPKPTILSATIDTDHILLLDNRFLNHKLGYEVMAKLVLDNSDQAILAKLGFISRSEDIDALISRLPTQVTTLSGTLLLPTTNRFVKHWTNEPLIHWPLIIQAVDIESIAFAMNHYGPMPPYIFHANTDEQVGLPTVQLTSYLTPSRHYGYSIQWGLLALMIVIGFLCATLNRREPK